MGKRYILSGTKCPWCKGHAGQVLYCEGLMDGMNLHLAFGSRAEFVKYREENCCGDYKQCPIANMLEIRWREQNEDG